MSQKRWGYAHTPRWRHKTIPLDLLDAWLESLPNTVSPKVIVNWIGCGAPWKWAEETGWTPSDQS